MEAVEEVVYTAEFGEDGLPHMVFAGPGSSRLMGGEVAFEDLWATIRARTDPGDRAERDAYFERIAAASRRRASTASTASTASRAGSGRGPTRDRARRASRSSTTAS